MAIWVLAKMTVMLVLVALLVGYALGYLRGTMRAEAECATWHGSAPVDWQDGDTVPHCHRRQHTFHAWPNFSAGWTSSPHSSGATLPASLEELKPDVPEYLSATNLAALRRMFERDKVELREFGIPIVTVTDSAGEVVGYQLRRDAFYLPYLTLMQGAARKSSPRRVDRYGYRALPELAFEADELEAVVEAARRVQQLGDPTLPTLAKSAMRKLAFDMPVDLGVREMKVVFMGPLADAVAPAARAPAADILQVLDEALRLRKHVTIRLPLHRLRHAGLARGVSLRPLLPRLALVPGGAGGSCRPGEELPGEPDQRCHGERAASPEPPTSISPRRSTSRPTRPRARPGNWATQEASRRWWISAERAARPSPRSAWVKPFRVPRHSGASGCAGSSHSPDGCCHSPAKWCRCRPRK